MGQNYFEAALLIELYQDSKLSTNQEAGIIDNIWPVIEQANQECPAHARISKSRILLISPDKPMARAGKGTVQRKLTLALYSKEIERTYAHADATNITNPPNISTELELADIDVLTKSIHQIICQVTSWEELTEHEDLFAKGLDSLQVIQIVRYLKAGLVAAGTRTRELSPSIVYTNSSVSNLAQGLIDLCLQEKRSKETMEQYRNNMMATMLDGFTASLQNTGPHVEPSGIILTGSTGTFGSYLLEKLYHSPSKSKINCLNRSHDSERRQSQINQMRGLTTTFDPERVSFLTADFSQDDFGLDPGNYQKLIHTTGLIIHNAWQVDFNLALSSFENTHVKGVRNLIAFSRKSQAKILFISSIGTVANWPTRHSALVVPERVITDLTVPATMGYAEAKYISERLLFNAALKFGIPVSICRVGQIAGPVKSPVGTWNKVEWLPSLIISSRYLGLLPDSLGTMETIYWIPIDLLSTVAIELAKRKYTTAAAISATNQTSEDATVYHAVNPQTTTWATLLPTVEAFLSSYGRDIKVVALGTWIAALRSSAGPEVTEKSLKHTPALKLLTFYESLIPSKAAAVPYVRLETKETEAACAGLSQLEAAKPEWMRRWLD